MRYFYETYTDKSRFEIFKIYFGILILGVECKSCKTQKWPSMWFVQSRPNNCKTSIFTLSKQSNDKKYKCCCE